ncbi:MAG: hypothetical protein KDJ41_03210 [Hyphomicrobiaceae bacterium]|nr:hypothetical protein [Hyphomicrobiaceae bacterium]
MSVLADLALIVGSVGALLAVMAGVRTAGHRFGWSAELQRKAVHVATGSYAMLLPLLFQSRWPVLLLVGVTLVVMIVLRLPALAERGIGSTVHGVERASYGDMLLALSIGFLFVRSQGNAVLYVLPLAVLTLSDAAAALAGSAYGRRTFAVEAGSKSLEGVAVFFLVTWIVAMVLLLLMTDVPRANVVTLGLLIAAFGALIEADSWRGFDNLFLPVGLHLFLAGHVTSAPLALAILAAGFVAVVLLMHVVGRPLGLTPHAARAHAVALFLICSYTSPGNAILPALAVIAHAALRAARPTRSPFPDLDNLAVLVGLSLFWLFIGEYSGPTAIGFYNLTFAGVTAALVCLTLAGSPRVWKIGIAAAAVGLLMVLFHLVASLDVATSRHFGDLRGWALASLVVVASLTLASPQWFDRYRSPRVAALAAAIPLVGYVSMSVT